MSLVSQNNQVDPDGCWMLLDKKSAEHLMIECRYICRVYIYIYMYANVDIVYMLKSCEL